jgi:hypothetical protein
LRSVSFLPAALGGVLAVVAFPWFVIGLFVFVFGCLPYGVGLSLHSYRSISFAPVRGGTYFLCRRKESKQRKRAHTASE